MNVGYMHRFLIVLTVIAGIFFLLLPGYLKSSSLTAKGDLLAQQNKLEEALIYYQEAYQTFPLKPGLADDIDSIKLRINSKLEYSTIVDETYAEAQQIPSLETAIQEKLGPDEIFVPILMYHHIRVNPMPGDPLWASLNVTTDQLNAELAYLTTNNYHIITLTDLYNVLIGKEKYVDKSIVLTFDDGYETFYQNAYPLLKKYNVHAIEFVITDVLTNPAYLTWGQIEEMDKSGLVEFGAHTMHHPYLTDLTANSANTEIVGSKKALEDHLGKPTEWFAYPYGSYNNNVISEVRNAGFLGAVSTNYSSAQSVSKLYVLPRIMVDGRFSLDEFARRIQYNIK